MVKYTIDDKKYIYVITDSAGGDKCIIYDKKIYLGYVSDKK